MNDNKKKIFEFIDTLYKDEVFVKDILIRHSKAVALKALYFAKNVKNSKVDLNFVEEASLLHDIGIIGTDFGSLNNKGDKPYIFHGIIGSKILKENGFSKYALVCERHIGFGLTKEEIINKKLLLPQRDMSPVTIEEKIVCLADKFFSKKNEPLEKEKSIDEIKKYALRHGEDQLIRFNKLFKEVTEA